MRLLPSILVLALVGVCLAGLRSIVPGRGSGEEVAFRSLAGSLPGTTAMPERVAKAGERLIGKPFLEHTLDGSDAEHEALVSRLDGFDCVTFVETSVALARASAASEPGYAAFQRELEQLRYRGGARSGYGSRLHYFSEWIADNARRGLVEDITGSLGGVPDTRRIHFMSSHRQAYAALSNQETFEQVLAAEATINASPRFMIPKDALAAVLSRLQSGDIVAIVTNVEGLDVVHAGLVDRLPDGSVHLLHAPEPGESVCVSAKPLVEYLQGYKTHIGVMIARPSSPGPHVGK
jgi:hypothetical protein